MVSNGMTPRLRAVMNSWGISLPLSISPAHSISAYTDFKSITVNYDHRLTSKKNYGDSVEDTVISDEELRQIAAETRGLFYHEVGHILFTVPFYGLLTAAWSEGYVVPSTIAQPAALDSEDTPLSWAGGNIGRLQMAWNLLEDQRMEAALVEESPHISSYLTVLVMRNMVSSANGGGPASWALAAGRYYLPDTVRASTRTLWESPVWTADDVEKTIVSYMVATTATDMVKAVLRMMDILGDMSVRQTDSHGSFERSSNAASGTEETKQRIADTGQKTQQSIPAKSDSTEPENSGQQGSGNDEQDDEGGQSGDQPQGLTEASSSSSSTSMSAGGGDDDQESYSSYEDKWKARNDIREALQDALEELKDDEAVSEDVQAMNEAHATDSGALPQWGQVSSSTDEEAASKALAIVDDIERAFLLATEDCAPHWETGQRRGVLDVLRYSTRQPGDVEVFRNYTDDGDPGHDLAVSLFLDISGSMMGTGDELGAAAWAVKAACDRLSISCDVSLFNENGYRLWEAQDSPEYIPYVGSGGGTDPTTAFNSILSEERPQKTHLVIVMTDGVWNHDGIKVSNWKHSNVYSVLFFYDRYSSDSKDLQPDNQLASKRGADEAYAIGDLLNIPQALENILISLV
jgi:hypothetical protein